MTNQLPLPPDDIRVNLELHLLVQAAVQKAATEERENFDPIKSPAPLIKVRLREVRDRVIEQYMAEHAEQAKLADTPKS